MAKVRSSFVCTACGKESGKWFGCCPGCQSWDTVAEQAAPRASTPRAGTRPTSMVTLDQVTTTEKRRMVSSLKEWDRVMGGGIMPGSLTIITGDPGIGKSTLLLHIANSLAERYRVFYFSSEESLEQVKLRAQRLQCDTQNILFSDHAYLDEIIATAGQERPDIVIIDSIQNCATADPTAIPGSPTQLKEAAFRLMRLAKERTIAMLISSHITKEGIMAGPKVLEHMVDTVVYLQGEDRWQTRILRAIKNRFGALNELGFFEMHEQGLQEVPNINEQLLATVSYNPGSVLTSYIEGSRPLLLELQALALPTKFSVPQRTVSGVDQTQLMIIAAILEKYLHVKLSSHDIFFRVSGGFKIKGSATDLGIALVLLSSYFQQPVPEHCLALGEISLTGHIKPVNHMGVHAGEAEKFGLSTLLVAKQQKLEATNCRVRSFAHVYELLELFELPS